MEGKMFRTIAVMAALASMTGVAKAYECDSATHDRASARIQMLMGTGVVQNGSGASVLVNDAYWHRMTYPEKQRFAEQFACAIAGIGKGLSRWEFRSLRTGNAIGNWNGYRLTVH